MSSNTKQKGYDIIEFKDGYYFLDTNKFYSKSENKFDFVCRNFYDINFKKIELPFKWLECLELQKIDEKKFCYYLARLFHSSVLNSEKKKTICLITSEYFHTSIIQILEKFFGPENIGKITKNVRFPFSQYFDKKVILGNIYDLNPKNSGELCKFISNELYLLQRSHVSSKAMVNVSPVIFLINKDENKFLLDDPRFQNRLQYFESEKSLKSLDFLEELPKIIVYCNKLFFAKKI